MPTTATSTLDSGLAATPLPKITRLRVLLGTLVAIEASGPSNTEDAIEAAFTAIAAVNARMHPQSADSDLARINHAPPGTPVTVDASTCHLLALARQLNAQTRGVFDPCLPSRAGRLQHVDVSGSEVFCQMPVALDFGGFAKGYAVDCAIEALAARGCTSGLVNAGGDLRVFGAAQTVLLRGPTGALTEIPMADAALAVSDACSASKPNEHQGYYVRGNGPGGKESPLTTRYAAVVAKQAVIADALTKCLLLCSREEAARVLQAFQATELADPSIGHGVSASISPMRAQRLK